MEVAFLAMASLVLLGLSLTRRVMRLQANDLIADPVPGFVHSPVAASGIEKVAERAEKSIAFSPRL